MIKRIILPCVAVLSLVLLIAACGGDGDDDPAPNSDNSAPTEIADGNGDVDGDNGDDDDSGDVAEFPTAAVPFSDGCQKSEEKQFPDGPETIIDTSKTYVATITMASGGEIVVELFSDTPITTNNFVFLACRGYYDGLTFHRVISGFMAQGGDPTGSGSGGPGYAIPDEDSAGHRMDADVISMAKAGPNTTGSQFFITYTPQPQLEADFTVFGQVTSGVDVVAGITPRDPGDPTAPTGDVMQSITIEES